MTTTFMIGPLVPIYAATRGMSPSLIGALVSLLYLAPLALAVPVGRRIDAIGIRPHLLAGATTLSVLPLLVAVWPDLWALALLQLGTGTAQVLVMLSGQAAVAGLDDGTVRLRNLGWYTAAIATGQLIGPVLAGAIADLWGFRIAFGASAMLALVSLAGLPHVPARRPATTEPAPPLRTAMVQLWSHAGIRIGMIASSAVLMTLAVNQAFLPIILGDAGYSATAIGSLFSLIALASLVVRPFVSRLVARFGGSRLAIVRVTVLVGLAALAAGVLTVPSLLVIVAIAFGMGSGVSQPTSMELVLGGARSHQRGAALGLRISGNRLAQLLGPLLLGVAAEAFGARAAFVGVGAVVVVVMAVVWRLGVAGEGRRSSA